MVEVQHSIVCVVSTLSIFLVCHFIAFTNIHTFILTPQSTPTKPTTLHVNMHEKTFLSIDDKTIISHTGAIVVALERRE